MKSKIPFTIQLVVLSILIQACWWEWDANLRLQDASVDSGDADGETECVNEACNGKDDDCDGVADEDYDCVLGDTVPCVTLCGSEGTRHCEVGCVFSDYCALPEERCNGEDDDCDGEIDEDFPCHAGELAECATNCGSIGTGICTAECQPAALADCTPPHEICGNGIDDDCDGYTDPEFGTLLGEHSVLETNIPLEFEILWTGDSYRVFWREEVSDESLSELYVATLSPNGDIIEPPFIIADSSYGIESIAVGNNESLIAIIWIYQQEECPTRSGTVNLWLLDTRRNTIDIETILETPVGHCAKDLAIEWNGNVFGLLWQSDGQFYFSTIDTSGNYIVYPNQITTEASPYSTGSLEFTDGEWIVVWRDRRNGYSSYDIYIAKIGIDGEKIGDEISISPGSLASGRSRPRVVWTGSETAVLWGFGNLDYDDTVISILDHSDLSIIKENRITMDDNLANGFDLVWNGSKYIAIINLPGGGGSEVHAYEINSSPLSIESDLRVSTAAGESDLPEAAWTGNEIGIVFRDNRSSLRRDLYFSRLGACE